jgi:ABC-type amino acid transport substrate-binding protein
MTKFVRLAALAAVATVAATPAVAAPVGVTGQAPKASVRIVKPLTLTRVRDLNFGTIIVGTVSGTQTVGVTDAGALTGCNTNGVTCQAVGVQSARYNVTGSNNQVVNIAASNVNLSNGTDTLVFTPNWSTNTVTLTSSGAPGNNFDLGGTIDLVTSTPEGLYSGDLLVTVDY